MTVFVVMDHILMCVSVMILAVAVTGLKEGGLNVLDVTPLIVMALLIML
jgi:hypothetical protein